MSQNQPRHVLVDIWTGYRIDLQAAKSRMADLQASIARKANALADDLRQIADLCRREGLILEPALADPIDLLLSAAFDGNPLPRL